MKTPPPNPGVPTEPVALFTYRERQSSTASVLVDVLGPLTDAAPQLWSQRTFLLLVMKIYERLMMDEGQLTSKEMQEIARSLEGLARAASRRSPGRSPHAEPELSAESIVGRMGAAVRDVYGTQFHGAGVEPAPG
jgi:hypothetical protein